MAVRTRNIGPCDCCTGTGTGTGSTGTGTGTGTSETGTGTTTCDCCDCSSATVGTTSIQDQTCNGCDLGNLAVNRALVKNGTLGNQGNPLPSDTCYWVGPVFDVCGDNEGQWLLSYNQASGLLSLYFMDTAATPWTATVANCTSGSSVTLSGGGGGSECTNYPGSINVTFSGCTCTGTGEAEDGP